MSRNNYCIYKHESPSGKIYIGQTCLNVKRRWRDGNGYKTQMFYKAIKKYGWDNFRHEILSENLTREDANIKEQEFIRKYKSDDKRYGYNIESGGNRGKRPSKETIEKNRQAHLGKHHSEEAKKKVSIANTGKFISQETRDKIGKAHKGKILSEDTRTKIRNARLGSKLSEEHKQKISEGNPNKKKVIQIKDGVIINVWNSSAEVEKEMGIFATSIVAVCKGKRKTAGGYIWKYIE